MIARARASTANEASKVALSRACPDAAATRDSIVRMSKIGVSGATSFSAARRLGMIAVGSPVVRTKITARLSVEDLAEAAHLSPRQFSRAFQAETGQSPAKAVENLRVEAARLMMEQTSHPIEAIAEQTGFADRERMRRAFLRTYGQPPQAIRRHARVAH